MAARSFFYESIEKMKRFEIFMTDRNNIDAANTIYDKLTITTAMEPIKEEILETLRDPSMVQPSLPDSGLTYRYIKDERVVDVSAITSASFYKGHVSFSVEVVTDE